MNTFDTLVLIFIILSGVLLAAAASVVGLIYYWQKKTQVDLKELRTQQRSLQLDAASARRALEGYTTEDPEPFGSLARELYGRLDAADRRLDEVQRGYIKIQEAVRGITWREPRAALRMPYEWYYLRQDLGAIQIHAVQIQEEQNEIVGKLSGLEGLSWEVARQARQVMDANENAFRTLTELRSYELNDATLEDAYQASQEWQKAFNSRIPVYFLSGDEAAVLGKSDKTTTSNVHYIMEQAKPEIENIKSHAETWQRQHEALEKGLDELAVRFRTLSEGMSALESVPVHPIEWNESRPQLANLRQQIENLGTIHKSRSLTLLRKDLETTIRLASQAEAMDKRRQAAAHAHQELLSLLQNPDLQSGEEWTRKAEKLSGQVEAYDPENWPRAEAAGRLRADVQALVERQARLPLRNTSTAIKETEVGSLLEAARQLVKLHEEIRPRLASIQARFTDLQETDRSTRDLINRTRALMNQAAAISGANHQLSSNASAEIDGLRTELEKIASEVEQPAKGALDKKAQRANALVRKLEQAGNRWLEKLDEGLLALKNVLAEKLITLAQIAIFEDPPVLEAQTLVAEQIAAPEPTRPSRKPVLPFSGGAGDTRQSLRQQLAFPEAVAEIKHKNEEWQRCVALTRAIEDLEDPVLDRYEKAAQVAEHVRARLAKAVEVIPEERAWPPTTQYISNEHRQFYQLEDRWEALKQERLRAIQVVSKLSELFEEYQSLDARISQIIERADQEQQRILELESRLTESMRLWQYQMQYYNSNLSARDDIQALIEAADQEAEDVRVRYLRGSIPYNQVLQNLRTICQKLEGSQAAIDQDQVIDINGIVQRRY